MSGCQKATVLVLLGAVVVVFWGLLRLVETSLVQPEVTVTPFALHTPTATATSTVLPLEATEPAPPPTAVNSPAYTATTLATDTPTATAVPPSATPQPSPTATETLRSSPTPVPQPTVPAEVGGYLKEFTGLVSAVAQMGALESSSGADQGVADQLRGIYRRLHEMAVPVGAEEMHLAFITYVSVLEEKCLCQIFAEAHSADAQGVYYQQCQARAATAASDLLTRRFLPSRDAFLARYSLSAKDVGFTF
jgi:hypothetical protein